QQFGSGHSFVEGRVDHTGRDAVDANAVRRELLGQAFSQTHYSGFGRRVNGRAGTAAVMPGDRSDVDNRAASAVHHFTHHGLRTEQRAFEVEIHHAIP